MIFCSHCRELDDLIAELPQPLALLKLPVKISAVGIPQHKGTLSPKIWKLGFRV